MAQLKGGTTGQILSKTSATDMAFTWITNDVGDITAVTATSPLTGGGTSGAITVGIQDATTSVKGSVQLSDSTSTTSSVLAATPTAVKSAYDLAAAAVPSTTNFFAGKNKIINGAFNVWQRGTSIAYTGSGAVAYDADRWYHYSNGNGSWTFSQQALSPATISGYDSAYFARASLPTVGTTTSLNWGQRVEDVRTMAGQSVTVSFWAKSDTARTINWAVEQNFGSGGSGTVTTSGGNFTTTTSFVRYTTTLTVPSISGKTVGTSSYLGLYINTSNITNGFILDIWGVQLEAASAASNFQTATGTIQGELAACQRYYWRFTPTAAAQQLSLGFADTVLVSNIVTTFPVTMRTKPTALEQSGTATDYSLRVSGTTSIVLASVPAFATATEYGATTNCNVASGLVAGQGVSTRAVNTNAYLGWSAEL
jgi:hypothetical protein